MIGRRGPEEPSQLAGDRDRCDGWAFPLRGEMLVAVVQADLCLPSSLVALGAAVAQPGRVAVGPGGFDQEPAGVPVAGSGDVSAVALLARGVLAGNDPEPRGQLTRVREAGEVADLADQPERGAGRDPSEPGEDLHDWCPPFAAGDLLEIPVKRVELTVKPVEVDEHLPNAA